MKRFKNILFVFDKETDGIEALERTMTLARKNKARLTVVCVIPDLPYDVKILSKSISPGYLQELLIKVCMAQMNQFFPPKRRKGITVSVKVLTGRPFIEIIREVIRNNHDLVIMAHEKPGGLKGRVFGSTAMHLIRKCPCPAWVMKPTEKKRYMKILAAVDPDPIGKKQNILNTKILELSTSLAQQEKSELHVVHTWTLYGESIYSSARMEMPKEDLNNILNATRDLHQKLLNNLLDKFPPMKKSHVHLLKGDPWVIIPSLSKQMKVDLIVMGTLSRAGLSGFFIGNTAEKILSEVNCSVLTVKPEGFVSPVKLK